MTVAAHQPLRRACAAIAILLLAAVLLTGCRKDAEIRDQASRTVSAAKSADDAFSKVDGAFTRSCERVQNVKRSILVFLATPRPERSPICGDRGKADAAIAHLYALPQNYIAVMSGIIDAKPVDYHIDSFFTNLAATGYADKNTLDAASLITQRLAAIATQHAETAVLSGGVRDIAPSMHVVLDALRRDFRPTACDAYNKTFCAIATIDMKNLNEQYSRLICKTFAAAIEACQEMQSLVRLTGYDPDDTDDAHFNAVQQKLMALVRQKSAAPSIPDEAQRASADLADLVQQTSSHDRPMSPSERRRLVADVAVLSEASRLTPQVTFADFGAATAVFGNSTRDTSAETSELDGGQAFYDALTQLENEQDKLYAVVTGTDLSSPNAVPVPARSGTLRRTI